MLRALVVTVTASLFVAASKKDPLAPYVFIAGVEGTGHHWFSSFFRHCHRPGKKAGECKSSDVGILEWQWVIAQIKKKPDAARFAVRSAAAAGAREAATWKARAAARCRAFEAKPYDELDAGDAASALELHGFKDDIEARIVLNLVVCGNLANVAFVFGRNAAPAIYISRLGAERLARAMFLSGVTIIAFTPRFSAFAKRRRATQLGGAAALILAQVTALLVSLWPNAATARLARIRASGHDKAAGAAVEADDDPWWKDALVLMLGAYTFLIIMVKTTLEYEYNVIVSETSTTEEMVALTGYLYAAAGTAASLMNLGGTRACLKQFGLSFASASYPLGLIAIIGDGASLRAALAARCLDLTARWSFNNTFKSVMWIAVSLPKARAARPYVESMTKKVSAALVALVLGAATAWGAGVSQLTLLALAGCGALLVVGSTLRTLYLEAMRHRVERRFVPLTAGDDGPAAAEPLDDDGHFVESAAQTLRDAATAPDGRDQLAATVFQRFETGATGARLFLLREIGAGALLRDDHVAKLFASFDLWDAPKVAGLRDAVAARDSRRRQARSSSSGSDDDAGDARPWADALVLKELARGDALLERLLGAPAPRAAAAAALLALGWGVGLGSVSSASRRRRGAPGARRARARAGNPRPFPSRARSLRALAAEGSAARTRGARAADRADAPRRVGRRDRGDASGAVELAVRVTALKLDLVEGAPEVREASGDAEADGEEATHALKVARACWPAPRAAPRRAAGARRLVYGPAADDDDDLARVAEAKVRARDAWKCLRTKDDRTKSAVLELLDTDLPPRLKPLVTPILDPAARDKASASRAAPLQISGAVSAWLRCARDALGDELADAVDLLFGSDEAAVPAPAERGILAAVSLLHVARPFEHALVSQHLAVLAEHCRLRRVGAESFAAQGESSSSARAPSSSGGPARRASRPGASFQDWHALGGVAGWDLPVLAATGHPDATVLVVDGDALKRSMDGVSPKFVFALLRALVTSLPEASQAGGGRIAKHLGRDRADSVALEENGALEAAASAAAPPQVLAPLEKVLLLRDAKMLRFVPERFLATLADVADARAVAAALRLAAAGKTDAALHVLADGAIELEIGDRCSAVLDEPSASFGNTAAARRRASPKRRERADRRARARSPGVAAARADYATGTSPQINMAFSPRAARAAVLRPARRTVARELAPDVVAPPRSLEWAS
ncbi:hypothetical protein JL720_10382 [Aureococcus anophagefferens]|nr:hypothetical protein JL720_10382 [Aureococcus anophagefferens]